MEKRVCRRCENEVTVSQLEEYSYSCDECDEDLFTFETIVIEVNERKIDKMIIETYKTERGDNFRMDYLTEYVIPMIRRFINKDVNNIDELKKDNYAPIWDTRNNTIIKKILEQLLDIKLSGVTKRDKIVLQEYLNA